VEEVVVELEDVDLVLQKQLQELQLQEQQIQVVVVVDEVGIVTQAQLAVQE
tara:strand:+ start:405 stop:557 length:153 start_codon:yes stop_codon:yes gene_type:complete